MVETESRKGRGFAALVARWWLFIPMAVVLPALYQVGYADSGPYANAWRFWTADFNPLPWLGALAVMAVYLRAYDERRARQGDEGAWSRWRVGSFLAGVLVALVLWESPINVLVRESMTLYTVKLMGEFEVAAPLIVWGIPFGLIDGERLSGWVWRVVRFLHRPAVTGLALAVILVLWDMSDQMALGLRNALVFLVLPGVYLGLGVLVWMQSLQVFPSWPNLHSHLKKAVYVWAMELAMMAMGAIWFWSGMRMMDPASAGRVLWGLTRVGDEHIAGAVMTGLSLPTMCLVTWHFWQWIGGIIGESESQEYEGVGVSRQET